MSDNSPWKSAFLSSEKITKKYYQRWIAVHKVQLGDSTIKLIRNLEKNIIIIEKILNF